MSVIVLLVIIPVLTSFVLNAWARNEAKGIEDPKRFNTIVAFHICIGCLVVGAGFIVGLLI
jgi:hypothetical protein